MKATLYFESYCPGCESFITNDLVKLHETEDLMEIRSVMEIMLNFVLRNIILQTGGLSFFVRRVLLIFLMRVLKSVLLLLEWMFKQFLLVLKVLKDLLFI